MNNYKGTYDGNTLAHYRTPGSKNGRTKYPGKYNPIGELAKGPDYNNSMNAARAYDTAQRAARQIALGPREMNNSYNQAPYQRAQARAMQDRNKAYGTAYGQMRTYGNTQAKANAAQRQANINSAKNVGTTPSHPTAKPNKGNYGAPSQQQLTEQRRIAGSALVKNSELGKKNRQKSAEERRIAGGNAGSISGETKATMARIRGSAMVKTTQQRQAEAERRRIAGGNAGGWNRADMNRKAAEERRSGGFSKTTNSAQSRQSNYTALVNRRNAEQNRSGATANKAAAEARRIAGGNAGGPQKSFKNSKYGKMATKAVDEAGSLVKKGKKKVKKLLKKWF